MEQAQDPNKVIIGIIVVVLLAVVGSGIAYVTSQDDNSGSSSTSVNETSPSSNNQSTKTTTGTYKDGTYTASGTYQSPGGSEEIEVTVTLQHNKITSTSATAKAASGTSRQYQQEFVSSYKALIVGKDINDVELDRVAGSSLTSNGFNDALEEIKQDATA